MVTSALNQMMTGFLPNNVLQRVKRYLRREARKPFDMNIKSYYTNITRINSLPPKFDETQSLAEDEIVDILLYGTPKSWQKEMDRQGFDPLGHTPMEVVAFMERIEASEEFDSDKKTTKVATSNKGKKKSTVAILMDQKVHTIVCCMAATIPMTLLSIRHFKRKLRS